MTKDEARRIAANIAKRAGAAAQGLSARPGVSSRQSDPGEHLIGRVVMFRITEGQYALGGLTVFAVWLFVILPLLNYSGTHDRDFQITAIDPISWVTLIVAAFSAVAAAVVAKFTIVLASVGRQQIADARILQRAYLSVEPQGIEWLGLEKVLIGEVVFKNVGKLPATEFVSVVKKIEVHDADWATPILTDGDFPKSAGVIPIGAEVPQGSAGMTLGEVEQANVSRDKYLYVYGRAKFKDGFDAERHVNFCHRYPWAKVGALTPSSGIRISNEFARYHQHGNNAD